MGGHVIKCGLAPVLIDLMHRGYATAFALNGAASIHDFEIALAGHTSEDVEAVLPDGRFGAAEETGREMNCAIAAGDRGGPGHGRSAGAASGGAGRFRLRTACCSQAYEASDAGDRPRGHRHGHAAHPSGRRSGRHRPRHASRFPAASARSVADLNDGGVYLNVGSAVVLPEVFLKAVSAVRNLGHPLADFTTVNFDFLQHYRPRVNVVERPHAGAGGRGYAITGHHELMIPLLAAALIEREP